MVSGVRPSPLIPKEIKSKAQGKREVVGDWAKHLPMHPLSPTLGHTSGLVRNEDGWGIRDRNTPRPSAELPWRFGYCFIPRLFQRAGLCASMPSPSLSTCQLSTVNGAPRKGRGGAWAALGLPTVVSQARGGLQQRAGLQSASGIGVGSISNQCIGK